MGRASAAHARALAEGSRCWLEFDDKHRDRYGRLLAFVHLEDGTVLNEAMLADGYAKVYYTDFRYLGRYLRLQEDARREGRGLWAGREPL